MRISGGFAPGKASLSLALLLSALLIAGAVNSVNALVPMNPKTWNHAIRYGLSKQERGYKVLLGPNWIEGDKGALLNVYSPYMHLAAKAYGLKSVRAPGLSDEERFTKAKDILEREIRYLKDPKEPKYVKFSVNLLEQTQDFPKTWDARIEGFSRGQRITLRPKKNLRPTKAEATATKGYYMAILSYYFPVEAVAALEGDWEIVFESEATKREERFTLNSEELY